MFELTLFLLNKTPDTTMAGDSDVLSHVVALVVGLAWPVTTLALLYVFRERVGSILAHVDRRIEKGDKVTALGVSVEQSPLLPAAVTSSASEPATTGAVTRLLSLKPDTDVLVVLGEISDEADESALVGSGDALALALIQATLLRVSGVQVTGAVLRQNRKAARDFLRSYRVVIVVGGPFGNEIAREVIDSVPLNLEFRSGGVYDKLTGELHRAKFSNGGMDGSDWAILVFCRNPKREGRVALVAGHSGYGTNAAAAVFANVGEYAEFVHGEPLEALIKVDIVDGVVQKPELIMARPLASVA
jgi:hypothetical protein